MKVDHINAFFEGGGALLQLLNIRQILKDRTVRGVHWLPLAFWTAWGFWNIEYYANLDQWWSFGCGLGVVANNCANLFLMWCFWPRPAKPGRTITFEVGPSFEMGRPVQLCPHCFEPIVPEPTIFKVSDGAPGPV